MGYFWKCLLYLVSTGVVAFILGRFLPKKWFKYNLFPYRIYKFEKNGQIYHKLHIKKWQNKVPDMSKIFPKLMPPKNMTEDYRTNLTLMIQETCIAEFIHTVNCFAGLYCIKLYPGKGGIIIAVLYAVLFNMPFILIQRYNRPRFIKLQNKLKDRNDNRAEKGFDMLCER